MSGASGGVGSWCVQLAKKLHGCHVVGICSERNVEYVQSLGADDVIDYTKEKIVETLLRGRPEGHKYDLFIDCIGGTDMFAHWVCNFSLNQCLNLTRGYSMSCWILLGLTLR